MTTRPKNNGDDDGRVQFAKMSGRCAIEGKHATPQRRPALPSVFKWTPFMTY